MVVLFIVRVKKKKGYLANFVDEEIEIDYMI